ncbi:uncharacterized protein CDAR_269241 [Caerostris darwini]|uniref:Gustatory receptor n=1 Tax=Caerostris darwini TaxID=1538125 RepID=A0AAV4NUW4_9ARAC|nr:uncharacterized protein CDAR_269241 [Caerostris darwini]
MELIAFFLMIFGIYQPVPKKPSTLLDRILLGCFKLYQFAWCAVLFCYLLIMINSAVFQVKIFLVHICDVLLVNVLWYILQYRLKLLEMCIKKQNNNWRFYPPMSCRVKIITVIFFIIVWINTVLNVAKMLTVSKILNYMEAAMTFGYSPLNQAFHSNGEELLIKSAIAIGMIIFYAFPPVAAVKCYLTYFRNYCLIRNYSDSLRNSFQTDLLRSKDFLLDLTKAVDFVKEVNSFISPVLFILISFWATGIFYNLTKILYDPTFRDNYNLMSAIFNVAIYSVQYLLLLALASKLPMALSDIRSDLLRNAGIQRCIFSEPSVSADVNLLMSILETFREDVTVSPLGLIELKRSLIPVSIGVLATYELLIVQILER